MNNTQEQDKKQYDWLRWYQFTKGVSGNPWGRPKWSKSLKVFVREYLESLPDEEKIKFLECLPPEVIWRMGEWNPATQTDLTSGGKPIPIIDIHALQPNIGNKEDSETK